MTKEIEQEKDEALAWLISEQHDVDWEEAKKLIGRWVDKGLYP